MIAFKFGSARGSEGIGIALVRGLRTPALGAEVKEAALSHAQPDRAAYILRSVAVSDYGKNAATAVMHDAYQDHISSLPDHRTDHHRCFQVSCRLAVSETRFALADFYNVTIRIANVAVRLGVRFLWLCDKLGSSIPP